MRPLHWMSALCIGLLSCGQLQAAFLFENSTPFPVAPSPQADDLGISNGTALEYGVVFQVVANPSPNPLSVSALGFYDAGHDGLLESHYVQLYQLVTPQNNPGTYQLIATTTIAAGTTDPLTGDFRYNSITPVNLAAGGTYLLLAQVGTLVSDPPGSSPEDKFAQLTEPVLNETDGGPLNNNFVEGNGTTGVGTAKSLIDTSGFGVGSQLFNPTSGVPNNSTTTIVQPGENFPFVVNLQFGGPGTAAPEASSLAVWTILGTLGLVYAHHRQISIV
jgi:hypothetical protein